MNTSFDQTRPGHSRFDADGSEYVRSSLDWCARCSKRLVGLDPSLGASDALDLAHELSLDAKRRLRTPEDAAEDHHRASLRTDD